MVERSVGRGTGKMNLSILSRIFPKRQFLGLDIGSSAIKFVELSNSRQGLALKYVGITERSPAEDGDENGDHSVNPILLRGIFQDRPLKGQKIAVNFSGPDPVIRHLMLPKMPQEEVGEAVRWEAKKLVQMPIEEMVLDYVVMGESREQDLRRLEVLMVAAERNGVLKQIEIFQTAGLPVKAMDINPLALLNGLKLNHSEILKENLAFVDIGAGKMEINIFKKGIARFTRNVRFGGEDITRSLMQGLQIDREEAEKLKREKGLSPQNIEPAEKTQETAPPPPIDEIIRTDVDRMILETQRSVDYYRAHFRESHIGHLILTGGACLMPGLKEYFASYFDSKVVVDDPFAGLICEELVTENFREMAPRFSTSVGLALRRTGE